jgi:hypothetical protein
MIEFSAVLSPLTGLSDLCKLLVGQSEFSKKTKPALMGYSVTWGKLNHEKTSSRTSRGTVSLGTFLDKEQI